MIRLSKSLDANVATAVTAAATDLGRFGELSVRIDDEFVCDFASISPDIRSQNFFLLSEFRLKTL